MLFMKKNGSISCSSLLKFIFVLPFLIFFFLLKKNRIIYIYISSLTTAINFFFTSLPNFVTNIYPFNCQPLLHHLINVPSKQKIIIILLFFFPLHNFLTKKIIMRIKQTKKRCLYVIIIYYVSLMCK